MMAYKINGMNKKQACHGRYLILSFLIVLSIFLSNANIIYGLEAKHIAFTSSMTVTSPSNTFPTAVIDTITPNAATAGEPVTFTGHGDDPDGTVTNYEWSSSIDGLLDSSSSSTYSTSSLSAGTHAISFRVQDNNGAWSSAVTRILTITAQSSLPSPPSNLTAVASSKSQINLTWTDNSDNENGFKIERCKDSTCTNFTQIAIVGVNATVYSNTRLKNNTTYRYRVCAYNATGNSDYSITSTAMTPRR
jgi:hypothetical protein